MIVNLSLIRLDTVLRLERQQIASRMRLNSPVRPCCAETHGSHESDESYSAILY